MNADPRDAVVTAAQAGGRLPSLAAAVVEDGIVVWASGDQDLQYRIGSITKVITAILVLQAREQGLLSLADPVGRHLPDCAYADRSVGSLLSHTGGLPAEPAGSWWERSPGVPFADLGFGPPLFEAGETFHYSNVGFAVLGEIAARVLGQDWWSSALSRVLSPLGMHRTTYAATAPHAQGYSVHPYAGTLVPEPHHDTVGMAAAGQLWSTTGDLARFADFLARGHDDVLPVTVLDEMAAAVTPGYGLGLWLLPGLAGHPGSMPGFQASLFVDRLRRRGAVALSNSTTGLVTDTITATLLAPPQERDTVAPWRPSIEVPEAVEEILGVWHWGNTPYVFRWEGAEVVASHLRTAEDRETFALRDGEFRGTSGYHHGETLHVVRRKDGGVSHLEVATFVFTRLPYDPAAPIPGGAPDTV